MLAGTAAAMPVTQFAQMIVRERVTVRVPMRAPANRTRIDWKEKKGERCVQLSQVAGAAVTEQASVDLILRGGARVRARLARACPALDFYSGFYLRPTADGLICADRDSIHSRAGGECVVERFRRLEPRPRKDR
jgi:hypothetical protein